jgi:acyl-CoA thioesterase-1
LSLIYKVLLGVAAVVVVAILAIVIFIAYSIYYGRPVPPARPGTIKVACVGDSITYGILLRDSYPSRLEQLLGSSYSVRNFGAIGHTAQKDGNQPYWGHRYFGLSTDFAPDIVILMLGSNDSKDKNWKGAAAFSRDYIALIEHYRSLPSKPGIVLMTPPSAFLVKGRTKLPAGINGEVIAQIADIVRQTGVALALPVIDMHTATADHPEFFQGDGIHPDRAGHRFMAMKVFEFLKARGSEKPR